MSASINGNMVGGGGASLPSATVEGQTLISSGAGTSYSVRTVSLPTTIMDAAAWLDFSGLADVSAGTACGAWPSMQGGAATLYDGACPVFNAAGAGGLDFSGGAGLIRVEGMTRAATSPFTVAALITPGTVGTKQWWVHWGSHVGLFVTSAGILYFEGGGALNSGVTPSDTTFVVGTWDGTTKKIYVDGTMVASAPASVSMTPTPIAIGARGDGVIETFNGIVHAAGGWVRALSAGEVSDLFSWVATRVGA